MVVMSDNVGTGYLPTTSSPPASASIAPPPEAGSPNVATSNILSAGGLATARVIRAEQKKFFFDLGSNARGQYLRISEVRFMIQRKCVIIDSGAHLPDILVDLCNALTMCYCRKRWFNVVDCS